MKNAITEGKNTLAGLSSRMRNAEDWTSELRDRMAEVTAVKKNEKKGRPLS